MDPYLKKAYDDYNKEIGKLFGQSCDIYRPPLGTIQDQTPSLVVSGVSYKVEKVGPILAQPGIYNTEFYAIFGDFSQIRAGDLIVPTDPESNTPIVTVINKSPGEGTRGFRTNRTCRLIKNISPETRIEDVIYSNVKFDFLPTAYQRTQFDDLAVAAGAVPSISALIYSLTNMQMNKVIYDIEGIRLIESDGTTNVRWAVKQVEEIGNTMHLTLTLDGR